MLPLNFSSYVLEFPNDAFEKLQINPIQKSKSDWLFNIQSRVLQSDWLILKVMIWHLCPIALAEILTLLIYLVLCPFCVFRYRWYIMTLILW